MNRKLPSSSVGEMLSYTLLKSEAAEFIESPAIKSPQQIKLLKSDDLDSDTCLCLQQRCQGGAFPNSSCNLVKSPKVSPDDDIWAGRQLRENNDDCASHTNHWCCNDMDRFEDSSWEILSSSSSLSKSSSHFELVDLVLFDDICEKDTGLNDELESSETTTYTKSYADVVKTPRKHQPKVINAEREKHTEISWRQIVPVTKSTAGPEKHTEMSLWQIVPVSKSTAGLLSNDTVTENAEHRFDNHPRNLSEKNAKKVSACEGCSYYSCSCSDDERCISLTTDLGFSFDSRDDNHQDPYLSSCRCCFEGGEFDFFVHADECLVDTDGWSIFDNLYASFKRVPLSKALTLAGRKKQKGGPSRHWYQRIGSTKKRIKRKESRRREKQRGSPLSWGLLL